MYDRLDLRIIEPPTDATLLQPGGHIYVDVETYQLRDVVLSRPPTIPDATSSHSSYDASKQHPSSLVATLGDV